MNDVMPLATVRTSAARILARHGVRHVERPHALDELYRWKGSSA